MINLQLIQKSLVEMAVSKFYLKTQYLQPVSNFGCTAKPVLSGHSKLDKTKVLKTHYRLMQVKSIAECSLLNVGQKYCRMLQGGAFCNTFDLL